VRKCCKEDAFGSMDEVLSSLDSSAEKISWYNIYGLVIGQVREENVRLLILTSF
jgi:hypothetical protein